MRTVEAYFADQIMEALIAAGADVDIQDNVRINTAFAYVSDFIRLLMLVSCAAFYRC